MIQGLIALLLLLLTTPIIIIITIIIISVDGFPVIFRQRRIGKNNQHFIMFKFRTMKKDTPHVATHLLNNPKDYLLPGANIFRKFSFDEIPNLINIVRGEMTFVGPRPALYNQEDLITLRTEMKIHKLKPGVTGWAQINGRDELIIEDKVKLDEYYLLNKSIFFDLKIIFLTILYALTARGVSH